MSEITVNAAKIGRLAYGYELMFSALCNIAGTSGGTTHWFTQKGQEVTARVDPLWKLTDDSNAHKPGDCLSQHVPYAAWAIEVERKASALEHWRQEAGKLHSKIDFIRGDRDRLHVECSGHIATIAAKDAELEALNALVTALSEELAGTYEELIDHNGDDLNDTRAKRVAALKGDAE